MVLAGALAAVPAQADHREIVQVSRGEATGNAAGAYASYGGVSADGSRVWFTTADPLLPEDTDNLNDVYERAGNALTLISVPEGGPYGNGSSGFVTASADGSSVVFGSSEPLTADDEDGGSGDWFLRRDGHTYLISKPDPGAFVLIEASPLTGKITPDGMHVFFASLEDLSPNDSNFQVDVYHWGVEDQTATPVSVRPNGNTHSSGAGINVVAVASSDGSRAFWATGGALVPEDTDAVQDVYMRENGQTTLVTMTTSATPADVTLRQNSDDGQHVFFQTTEALVPEDTDTNRDVYEVTPGGESQLVSIGTQAGPTSEDVDFQRTSADGLSAWFTTLERLTPDDTDDNQDIYMRHGGQTTLETQGPTGGNTGFDDIVFSGIVPDGSRMYFTTHEALTADDEDPAVDIYERHAGTTRRVSIGAPGYDNGFVDTSFAAASPDGSRIVYQAEDPMSGEDTDFSDDLYEAFGGLGGALTLLTGGTENVGTIWGGASADASHVFFTSSERLTAFDTDDQPDVFESRINRAPTVTVSPAGTRVAGDPATAADAAVAIDDPEDDALTGATIALTGALDATESLGYADAGSIHGELSSDGRTLTLSGAAARGEYEAALRSVSYGGASSAGTRGISFTVSDGFDTSSATRAVTVSVTPAGSQGAAGGDVPSPPAPPPSQTEPEPSLSTSGPSEVVVNGDTISVGCSLSSGALESCEAEARAGSTAARLVRVGHGRAEFAGGKRGTVKIRLTRAGMKLLRERRRASRLVLSVAAHPRGSAEVLRDRRSVRVLLAGTELRPEGMFAAGSARLGATTRASLRRFARDLRRARIVRCAGGSSGTESGALGLKRARSACAYLRRLGVRAQLRTTRAGAIGRRVVLRVSG
jgi:hypothetical protein